MRPMHRERLKSQKKPMISTNRPISSSVEPQTSLETHQSFFCVTPSKPECDHPNQFSEHEVR